MNFFNKQYKLILYSNKKNRLRCERNILGKKKKTSKEKNCGGGDRDLQPPL